MVVVLVVPKTLLRARSPLQAGVGGYIYINLNAGFGYVLNH